MAGRGITAVMDHHAGRFFLKTTLAAGLAAAAIAAVLAAVPGDDMGLRLLRLGVGAAAGLGIYSVTLLGLGVPEAAAAARLLGGRLVYNHGVGVRAATLLEHRLERVARDLGVLPQASAPPQLPRTRLASSGP